MAGMATAASKIKLLAKLTNLVPLVGPTAGGLLHGLSRVCEAAARFRAAGKEALRLMDQVTQVTEGILVKHRYVDKAPKTYAARVCRLQEDVEAVLKTAQIKFLEVYGDEALSRAKRAYAALFSGKDNVTFDGLEQKLRDKLVWYNDMIQTIQVERDLDVNGTDSSQSASVSEDNTDLDAFLKKARLSKYASAVRDVVGEEAIATDLLEMEG